jgi:tRNA-dependent cyclodipeptide synthase
MLNSAFVGVSLDSVKFSRAWIRFAIRRILAQHDELQFVLADRLLAYNKLTRISDGSLSFDLEFADRRIKKRSGDIRQFLTTEVERLPKDMQERVSIAGWNDYSDANYTNIARALNIAYTAIPKFRSTVDEDVEIHLIAQTDFKVDETHRRLCASYVLEESAMIIRITELGGRRFDFYPEEQIRTLRLLYENEFACEGLDVERLIGHPRLRIFTPLPLIEQASAISRLEQFRTAKDA